MFVRMRANSREPKEDRTSGELWDNTSFPSWSVSHNYGELPLRLFLMSLHCNASYAAKQ